MSHHHIPIPPTTISDSESYEMVQSYGTPGQASKYTEADDSVTVGEGSALLAGDSTAKGQVVEGHASLTSCISNLANTIIGSGT
jgi:hypothetical protein